MGIVNRLDVTQSLLSMVSINADFGLCTRKWENSVIIESSVHSRYQIFAHIFFSKTKYTQYGEYVQLDLTNRFSDNFSLIQFEEKKNLQTMLATYGSHSEFFLLRKYHFHKKLQFQTILLPYKKCVTKKRTHVKKGLRTSRESSF